MKWSWGVRPTSRRAGGWMMQCAPPLGTPNQHVSLGALYELVCLLGVPGERAGGGACQAGQLRRLGCRRHAGAATAAALHCPHHRRAAAGCETNHQFALPFLVLPLPFIVFALPFLELPLPFLAFALPFLVLPLPAQCRKPVRRSQQLCVTRNSNSRYQPRYFA